ncbi:MAG: hypothetical protein ACRC7O_08350, partial [Fimbriiglobus sp.]
MSGQSYVLVARNGVDTDQPKIGNIAHSEADAEYARYTRPTGGPMDISTFKGSTDVGVRVTGASLSHWGDYQSDHQYVQ